MDLEKESSKESTTESSKEASKEASKNQIHTNQASSIMKDLHQLTEIPETSRDNAWETEFFKSLTLGNLEALSLDPQYGPDGWPYLFTKTSPQAVESFQKILHWLSERGIGLAVNPQKKIPDYIFTYGMIWYFKESGYFYLPTDEATKKEKVEFTTEEVKKFGAPTEAYLPLYVRKMIKEFLQQQGILIPKILMLSLDEKNYDLAFSLESMGNPPEADHQIICESIGWFLPPHYSLMLVSENGLPPFQPL